MTCNSAGFSVLSATYTRGTDVKSVNFVYLFVCINSLAWPVITEQISWCSYDRSINDSGNKNDTLDNGHGTFCVCFRLCEHANTSGAKRACTLAIARSSLRMNYVKRLVLILLCQCVLRVSDKITLLRGELAFNVSVDFMCVPESCIRVIVFTITSV